MAKEKSAHNIAVEDILPVAKFRPGKKIGYFLSKTIKKFNLTEDDFIKHGKYGIPIRVGTKENSMMSPMRNFIARGFKFKKPKVKTLK